MNTLCHILCYIVLYQILCITWIGKVDSGHSEKRLLKYLFDQKRWDAHNPMERPVSVDGKPVQVFLKCFLNQIMDVKWSDYHFHWNASDYENIRQINLPPERIWKPDILLYNSASEKFDQIFPTKVIVRNTGNIQWVPPGLFHSICDIEVNWFPFDSQNCIMKLGTWTYQGNTVDLKLQCDNETEDVDQPCHYMNDVDLSTYLAHSEWALEISVNDLTKFYYLHYVIYLHNRFSFDFHISIVFHYKIKQTTPPHTLGASIKRNIQTYGGEDQTYIDVTIYVYMQRRALYYMFNIIIPCMIMSMMALLVFTLPPEANEKIVLGVTTLLSLTMLLQLVADKLPQTSSGNPVLGGIVYVPWWIETLINIWLASILRIDHDLSDPNNNDNNDNHHGDNNNNNKTEPNLKNSKEKLIPSENSFQLDPYDYDKINHHIHLNHSYNTNNSNGNGNGNNNVRNATVWSNIIDMNSEFRPAIVIHKPFKHNPNHNGNMKKSLFINQIKLKSELQSRIQQNYFIDLDLDYDRDCCDQHRLSTDLLGKPLNNMPYPTSNTNTILEDKGNSRTNATSRLQYTCKRNLTEKSKYFNKTIPRFHLSSSSSSSNESPHDSSLSSSPTPLPPASSSSSSAAAAASSSSSSSRSTVFSSPNRITDPSSSSPFKQNHNNNFDIILLKLKQISNELRFITSDMHNKDKEIKTSNQWRLACRVLDRLCLLIFTALNLFTTLGILTSAPTVIKAFTSRGAPSQPM
ncbi:nicotinic acetylcholine receptor, invertebrate [Schistosoma bovis]|uniref:Nicotinic acetylcholine receptor, invertebrate n=1 Tax=Schistosoma bovis TaxID=6184 RepID=A0A430QET6_SCHBO|nr:nicotinic acetylcholine receptor, invertebrate [Schistosoma bovis]